MNENKKSIVDTSSLKITRNTTQGSMNVYSEDDTIKCYLEKKATPQVRLLKQLYLWLIASMTSQTVV